MRSLYHTSFFNFITIAFGFNVTKSLKLWIRYNKDLIVTIHRIHFLQSCKRRNLYPQHLTYSFKRVMFYHLDSKRSFDNFVNIFKNKLLRLETIDAFKHRSLLIKRIFQTSRFIESTIPHDICSQFFNSQSVLLTKYDNLERTRMLNKLTLLIERRDKDIMRDFYNLDKLEYHYNSDSQSFSLHNDNSVCSSNIKVSISPKEFKPLNVNVLEPKQGWFINLTNVVFPPVIQGLLQLGEGFCLPPNLNNESVIVEFIKHFEYNIKKLPIAIKGDIKNQLRPLLNKLKENRIRRTQFDHDILSALSISKQFLRDNQHIIFTRADKGNAVVALGKQDYIGKMENLLNDNTTYSVLKRNPVNNVLNGLKDFLKRWKIKEYISNDVHAYLNTSNAILPRAYGLPKIHKPGCPLRIIVSSVGSPLHGIASFLHKIIYKSIPFANSYVKNSFKLSEKIADITLDDNFQLISLDVVSLFTNVPVELAINSIDRRWHLIGNNTKLPKVEFLDVLRFILNSTFFMFNNKFYKQTFGAPMGSPLSPVVADLVLRDLEEDALKKLSFIPPFYYRYVDDIVLAAPSSQFDNILNVFNSYHDRLKFTMEVAINDKLNFLDLTLILTNNRLTFDWFHKPTFSGRFLNFLSCHPICHKRGTVIGLIDRAFFLSSPKFHKKNFVFVVNILQENGYPLDFIFNTLTKRLPLIIRRFNDRAANINRTSKPNSNDDDVHNFFVVPYVPGVSDKFKPLTFNKNIIHLAFIGLNKLSRFIKVPKDTLPLTSRANVVYRINCLNCDASYVGQTGRLLKTRIAEHKNQINRVLSHYSVVTEHRLNTGHEFDWNNVSILDEEKIYVKRLVSEMIFIKKQNNGLNLQSDTEFLDPTYLPFIDRLRKF